MLTHELITEQLAELLEVLAFLLLIPQILPPLHFDGNEAPSSIHELLLSKCELLSVWLGLELQRILVELVDLVAIIFLELRGVGA